MASSHAIGSICECPDYQFLVLVPPSSHVLIRINHGTNKVGNIFSLSILVVKGYMVRCQRLKGCSDVDLGTARDTEM